MIPPAQPVDPPPAHVQAFRAVWLARYGSLGAASALADQYLAEAEARGDERLALRMRLVRERLAPPSAGAQQRYLALAERLQALGDEAGAVMARSFALVADNFGGDFPATLAAYERLEPAIHQLEDPLERHVALGTSLFLYQAAGNAALYMQQAGRMLQLADEVNQGGMRSAALSNVGIAYFLVGDDLQARQHLEQSLESAELGGWLRFSAVAILAEVYLASGDVDRALALLTAWSLPAQVSELDGPAVEHFHALGAEVYTQLGQLDQAQACLDVIAALPGTPVNLGVPCMLTAVRALHRQRVGDAAGAQAALDEALRQSQLTPGGDASLPARFWRLLGEVAATLGHWQLAYQLQDRSWQVERSRKQELAAVRRAALQMQTDANASAIEAAQRDPLTGLGNRERLVATGEQWLARQLAPVVVKLNLRRFKAINEALGRDTGDAVLQAVADRLREACSQFAHAVAARVYADQFAVVLAGGEASAQAWQRVAFEMFSKPLGVAGHSVDLSAAWGVATGLTQAGTMRRLLSRAEVALNEDRRTLAGWTVYTPDLVRADSRQLSLVSELKRAATEDEFILLLQPKFRLADDAVVSFEALLRWIHPGWGVVPPAEFIPFAESTGSIKGITAWVLRRAMQLSVQLRAAGLPCEIAVNVSVHDVEDAGFVRVLQDMLSATGARAGDIRLELTEGAVMRDPATVIDRMQDINAMGFEWSIDDFGTGQSSLAYLNMLPVSELKIDRSFVRAAAASQASLTLLKAAIDLGRNLGLATVGEGAETQTEWELLRELGCGVAQGWFGARPMPEQELLPWLRSRVSG